MIGRASADTGRMTPVTQSTTLASACGPLSRSKGMKPVRGPCLQTHTAKTRGARSNTRSVRQPSHIRRPIQPAQLPWARIRRPDIGPTHEMMGSSDQDLCAHELWIRLIGSTEAQGMTPDNQCRRHSCHIFVVTRDARRPWPRQTARLRLQVSSGDGEPIRFPRVGSPNDKALSLSHPSTLSILSCLFLENPERRRLIRRLN